MSSPIEGWKVGDRVIDDDGHVGSIIKIDDVHNVHVNLDDVGGGEGRAIYCCDPECKAHFPCHLISTP